MPKYNSGPRGNLLARVARFITELSAPAINATTGTITTVNATTVNATDVDASGAVLAPRLRLDVVTAIPTARTGPGAVAAVSNSTGVMLAINTTGTTWRYMAKTSVLA